MNHVDNCISLTYDSAHLNLSQGVRTRAWSRMWSPLLLLNLILFLVVSISAVDAKSDGSFPGKGDYQTWQKANVFFNRGNESRRHCDYSNAIASLERAIEIYPFDSNYYFKLGLVFHEKKEFDQASSCYKKAINLEPHFYDALFNLGCILHKQNKDIEARQALEQAKNCAYLPKQKEAVSACLTELNQVRHQ